MCLLNIRKKSKKHFQLDTSMALKFWSHIFAGHPMSFLFKHVNTDDFTIPKKLFNPRSIFNIENFTQTFYWISLKHSILTFLWNLCLIFFDKKNTYRELNRSDKQSFHLNYLGRVFPGSISQYFINTAFIGYLILKTIKMGWSF